MDQEAQTVSEWLAGGSDVPEVGRGGGRVLSGTTGELATRLQHIAGCPSCKARWPRAGYVAMELAGDHVAFTVDVAAAEPEPTRPEVTPEGEPKASRALGTLLDASNRVARLVGVPEATSHQHATPHLIKVLAAAAEALEWIESYK